MPIEPPHDTESIAPPRPRPSGALTEADAIEIWIARWLRIRVKDLLVRYNCDSRRIYDIWHGRTFPGSRGRAQKVYLERYPGAGDRTDFGYRRIPKSVTTDPRQSDLFG